MKKNMLDYMQNISDETILEFSQPKQHKIVHFKRYIAACVALIFVLGISVTLGVEAKEYNKAVEFFNENNLTTEDLSRTEIKTIYKDITTKQFTYEKTAQLITSSVKGFEVLQEEITPQDLKTLWENIENKDFYFISNEPTQVNYICEDYDFIKYEKDEEIWRIFFNKYWIVNHIDVGENILAFGHKDRSSNLDIDFSIIALIDPNGKIIWEKELENLSTCAVVFDGTEIAVFSRKDLEYFCFNKYDLQGNLTQESQTFIGNKGIWSAVAFGENYLVEIVENGIEEIFKVSSTGEMLESFSYSTEKYHYNIQNMIEFNGNVFFSAYSVPIENAGYPHAEIQDILEFAFDNKLIDKSNALTPKVQENYKAVLLIFNENLETPQVFYEIDGSMGSNFKVDSNNNLVWRVETIADTFFSPATSSFSIGGSSFVYEYKFDKNGELLEFYKTDEIVNFRK